VTESYRCDVLIIGAGLAGLTLARQLLLTSRKRVLLLDHREFPPARQKVGEATVQLSAYYLAKVLDLEEHLLREHFLKYNLRFYWKTGSGADRIEAYSQSFIRNLSNIATYQLDRNRLEIEILRLCNEQSGFTFQAPVTNLALSLSEGGPHSFTFRVGSQQVSGAADWVVDASGRGRVLARGQRLSMPSPIRHGASFMWVDGLVDIERLTQRSARERRIDPARQALGHVPLFLATNHFMGEGYWFWVIPLHGKTSLGLVYDTSVIAQADVAPPRKLIDWVCREFPLFAADLRRRPVLDYGSYRDFALDARQMLSHSRWAITGEACRFSDPLYSPGGDMISIHNTLIADAIMSDGSSRFTAKVTAYEHLARALFDAYVPSYAVSYDVLGDQEVFSLRYVWELSVYFGFYVFPFINDLFTDERFATLFLQRFARLGRVNRGLHEFLKSYYRWKKERGRELPSDPVFFDFAEVGHLRTAEACFYRVGLDARDALVVIEQQLASLDELARWIVSHVIQQVTRDDRASSHSIVNGIDLTRLKFDVEAMRALVKAQPIAPDVYAWSSPVPSLGRFHPLPTSSAASKPSPVCIGGAA